MGKLTKNGTYPELEDRNKIYEVLGSKKIQVKFLTESQNQFQDTNTHTHTHVFLKRIDKYRQLNWENKLKAKKKN